MEVSFADQTLNLAFLLGLSEKKIRQIMEIFQKYPVSCFDIGSVVPPDNSTLRGLLPNPMLRINVHSLDAVAQVSGGFLNIRIYWEHRRESGLEPLYKAAEAAKPAQIYLAVQNAWELGPDEFAPYFEWARRVHAKGITYCSNGKEDVFSLCEKLSKLVSRKAPFHIEFEGTDSLGLATAQTLAALKAGVGCVSASVAGIGGSAPMEEIMMAAKHLWKYRIPQGKTLAGDFQLISSLLGVRLPRSKALIGPDVFAHESGIHVDGIIKDPSSYEVIRPEDVGLKRKLVIGKHSGTTSLKMKISKWGFLLSDEDAAFLLESVREFAQEQKGPLSDRQLLCLFSALHVKAKSYV